MTKIQSAGAKPQREERSFSTQSISQERVLPWRFTALKEMGLSGFSAQILSRFSQRAGFHEGEKGTIYQCMPIVLILTISFFLVVFFLSFPPLFSLLFLLSFLSSIQSSRCSSSPLFCSRQDPPFIVPTVTRFYCFSP